MINPFTVVDFIHQYVEYTGGNFLDLDGKVLGETLPIPLIFVLASVYWHGERTAPPSLSVRCAPRAGVVHSGTESPARGAAAEVSEH